MAIPYHQWKVYSRTKGMSSKKAAAYSSRGSWGGDAAGTPEHPYSAVAAAAYVARTKTWDRRYTKAQDYSRKTDLVWSGILADANAPSWVYDRQKLWTAVEEREDLSPKRLTAQLFRGTVIALPRELTPEQRVKLVTAYIQDHYAAHGMIADINIHNPKAKDGGEQPHAHVMLTMREIGPDGFGLQRRDGNDVDFGIRDGIQHYRAFAKKAGAESPKSLALMGKSVIRSDRQSFKSESHNGLQTSYQGERRRGRRCSNPKAKQICAFQQGRHCHATEESGGDDHAEGRLRGAGGGL